MRETTQAFLLGGKSSGLMLNSQTRGPFRDGDDTYLETNWVFRKFDDAFVVMLEKTLWEIMELINPHCLHELPKGSFMLPQGMETVQIETMGGPVLTYRVNGPRRGYFIPKEEAPWYSTDL